MLTSSLGWMGFLLPITPPASSMARLEMTSLAFMLVWVPLPVCQICSGKWSSSLPSITSSAAWIDELGLVGGQHAEVLVDLGGGLLEDAEGADQLARHDVVADIEMNQRALGLRSPVTVGRNLDRPHAVGFGPSSLAV